MRKRNIDVVAIDLKICFVIATVSDFEVRHSPDDVERNENVPAASSLGSGWRFQLFSELGAVAPVQPGGLAYMAHVGEFIFGAITARPFERFFA